MVISIIAAVARNGVVGKDNTLPWSLPEDLKRFRAITSGHTVIMGRKTYESIGKALPKRRNIVVSRNADYQLSDAETATSLTDALQKCASDKEVFVIGGPQLWNEALPLADKLYLTEIDQDFDGDAFFPSFNKKSYRVLFEETHATHAIPHSFRDFTKNL